MFKFQFLMIPMEATTWPGAHPGSFPGRPIPCPGPQPEAQPMAKAPAMDSSGPPMKRPVGAAFAFAYSIHDANLAPITGPEDVNILAENLWLADFRPKASRIPAQGHRPGTHPSQRRSANGALAHQEAELI